jgi:hypothetical protein
MASIERYDSNPTYTHISEYIKLVNGLIAHKFSISGTSIIGYEVYRQFSKSLPNPYSSYTSTPEYGLMGDITTERLPRKLEAMQPGTDERIAVVVAFHKELQDFAERNVRLAFPADFAEVQI